MKKLTLLPRIIFIALLIIYSSLLHGQKTIEDVIKSELEEMLIKGDIIITSDKINDLRKITRPKKEKNEALKLIEEDSRLRKAILSEYPYPIDGKNEKINLNLVFKGINMSYLGSYLISDTLTVKTGSFPKNANPPQLPWLVSNSQVGLTNPNRNNYNLFSNLTYLVSLNAEMGLGVNDNPYFDNKAKTAIFKSKENNQTLSIAYGTFNNTMASLFSRAKLKGQFDELEISPLLYLWMLYAKGQIDGNQYVLNSFDAMSLYRTSKVELKSKTDFSNENSFNISSIPFLQLSGNSNFNWTKKKESSISENTYNIFMTSKPTFEKIPSVSEIVDIWNVFSENDIIYVEGSNSLSISKDNNHNMIKAVFGPLFPELKKRISINKESLISQMDDKFISDVNIVEVTEHPNKPGYYIVNIKFVRNNEFYQALSVGSPTLTENLKMEIDFLDPIDEYKLNREYNLTLVTETLPIPHIDKNSIEDLSTNNMYKVKLSVNVQAQSVINSASITNIELQGDDFKDFETKLNLSDYQGQLSTPNTFEFDIVSNIDHDKFSQASILKAKITVDIVENGIAFQRKIDVRLPYSYPEALLADAEANSVTFESVNSIIELLPDSTLLNNNEILSDYLENATDTTLVKSNAFDLLKISDKEKIKFLKSGYFQVNKAILDKQKINAIIRDIQR